MAERERQPSSSRQTAPSVPSSHAAAAPSNPHTDRSMPSHQPNPHLPTYPDQPNFPIASSQPDSHRPDPARNLPTLSLAELQRLTLHTYLRTHTLHLLPLLPQEALLAFATPPIELQALEREAFAKAVIWAMVRHSEEELRGLSDKVLEWERSRAPVERRPRRRQQTGRLVNLANGGDAWLPFEVEAAGPAPASGWEYALTNEARAELDDFLASR